MKRFIALSLTLLALTACQTKPNRPSVPGPSAHAIAVSTLQNVNTNANSCWLKDKSFKSIGIVPELDTTGTPRILVIPKGNPQALPQLVISASGRSVQVFGPLATSPLAPRINADVSRWAAGGSGCTA